MTDKRERAMTERRRNAVLAFVEAFTNVWEGSEFGPAHIVLSDYNLIDEHLDWTRQNVLRVLTEQWDSFGDHEIDELRATLQFLRLLKLIPEDWRAVHGEECDDDES
jgi:hypothetical protein